MIKDTYKFAIIATDTVVFTIKDEKLQVLLIKINRESYIDHWAAPGGLVKPDESVDHAVQRHLVTKTGIKNTYLEQLYTFGDINRDPFGRIVSVAYFALISNDNLKLKTTEQYLDIKWFAINKLPKMAYDHRQVIKYAVSRLRSKLEYANIICNLLPSSFTLNEMQKTYEIILDKKLDKRNFRKKILSLGLIKNTGKTTIGNAHRPALLYRFVSRSPQNIKML